MWRIFSFFYLAAFIILAWEGLSFYQSFYRSYESIIEASINKNLILSESVDWSVAAQPKQGEVNLIFVGDIMLTRSVGIKTAKTGDFRYPFLQVASTTEEAGILFGNLETTISVRGRDQGSIYSFRSDPRVLEGLTYAGFDAVSLANNHIWDWGPEALRDTIDYLKKNGIEPVGAGKNETEANQPVFIKRKNTTFAFLAYTNLLPQNLEARGENPGLSRSATSKVVQDIKNVRSRADVVVVSFHWGDEYVFKASGFQRKLAQEMVTAGADLVLGHHPHVVQEVEPLGNGWVAYSLGNFVFDQNFSTSTRSGLALKVRVRNGRIEAVDEQPVIISTAFQPFFASSTLVE